MNFYTFLNIYLKCFLPHIFLNNCISTSISYSPLNALALEGKKVTKATTDQIYVPQTQ